MKYTIDETNKTLSLKVKENILTVSIKPTKFASDKRVLKEYCHDKYGYQNEFERLLILISLVCKVEDLSLSTFSITRFPVKMFPCKFPSLNYKQDELITIQDICASTRLYNLYKNYYQAELVKKESNQKTSLEKKIVKYKVKQTNNTESEVGSKISIALTELGDLIRLELSSDLEITKQKVDELSLRIIEKLNFSEKEITIFKSKVSWLWSYISLRVKALFKTRGSKNDPVTSGEEKNRVYGDSEFRNIWAKIKPLVEKAKGENVLFTSGKKGRPRIDNKELTIYVVDLILKNKDLLERGETLDVTKPFLEKFGKNVRYDFFTKASGEINGSKRRLNVGSKHSLSVANEKCKNIIFKKAKARAHQMIQFWFYDSTGTAFEEGRFSLVKTRERVEVRKK